MRAALPALLLVVAACGPRRADLAMSEGIAAHEAGDREAAQARYLAALRLDPSARGAANNLAVLAIAEGDLAAAVARLTDELARHPALAEAQLNKAWLLLRGERYAEAAASLSAVVESGGDAATATDRQEAQADARALLALARLYAEAPHDSVLAAAAAPASADGAGAGSAATLRRLAIGLSAARAERWEDARRALERAPTEAVRPTLAAVLLRAGDPDGAARLLETATRTPTEQLLAASAAAARGRDDEASALLAVLPTDTLPSSLVSSRWRLQAALASRSGRWDAALEAVDAALAAAPSPDLWLDRATALAHLGRLDEAGIAIAGVLRDAPDDPRARALQALLAP